MYLVNLDSVHLHTSEPSYVLPVCYECNSFENDGLTVWLRKLHLKLMYNEYETEQYSGNTLGFYLGSTWIQSQLGTSCPMVSHGFCQSLQTEAMRVPSNRQ